MELAKTIIICVTILLFTGIIVYGITINELQETPYEQCLKVCQYGDKLACSRTCTEEFGEIINNIVEEGIPLIKSILEEANPNCSQ